MNAYNLARESEYFGQIGELLNEDEMFNNKIKARSGTW